MKGRQFTSILISLLINNNQYIYFELKWFSRGCGDDMEHE